MQNLNDTIMGGEIHIRSQTMKTISLIAHPEAAVEMRKPLAYQLNPKRTMAS